MIKTSQPPCTLYNPLQLGNCPHSHIRLFVNIYVFDLRTILVEKALNTISEKKQYHLQEGSMTLSYAGTTNSLNFYIPIMHSLKYYYNYSYYYGLLLFTLFRNKIYVCLLIFCVC